MAHVRRSRSAAHALGRRRPLTAPAAAGALVRTLNERLGSDLRDLWTDEDTVEFSIDGARNVDHHGWSVVASGRLTTVRSDERTRALPLRAWAPRGRDRFVAITIDELSGRRVTGHP